MGYSDFDESMRGMFRLVQLGQLGEPAYLPRNGTRCTSGSAGQGVRRAGHSGCATVPAGILAVLAVPAVKPKGMDAQELTHFDVGKMPVLTCCNE
jgi:hypothetical protein